MLALVLHVLGIGGEQWLVLGSVAEAAVSLGCQPGGCCWCDFGFGCGRLETADAYRGVAAVPVCGIAGADREAAAVQLQVYSAGPGRRAVSRWAAAVLLRALSVDGSVHAGPCRGEATMWPVLGSGVEAAVSPGCRPGGCCCASGAVEAASQCRWAASRGAERCSWAEKQCRWAVSRGACDSGV